MVCTSRSSGRGSKSAEPDTSLSFESFPLQNSIEVTFPAGQNVFQRLLALGAQADRVAFPVAGAVVEQRARAAGDPEYEGIGLRMRGSPLMIEEVFRGTPAEAAGLLRGDLVQMVDGEDVSTPWRSKRTASMGIAVRG